MLLKTDFLEALRADFAVHGADVIAACRADDPLQYMKLIAALLPKDAARKPEDAPLHGDAFNHLSDDELLARIRTLEHAIDATAATHASLPALRRAGAKVTTAGGAFWAAFLLADAP